MNFKIALAALLAVSACHRNIDDPKVTPVPGCSAAQPDGGSGLETPCAGKPDGTACCLGAQAGACAANRCAVK